MIYKFIVEFYGEKLFDWSKKERLLQLPTRKNPQMYFVNLRAVTRLFNSEKPEWINCIAEEGVRFKRAISGSTRQKKIFKRIHYLTLTISRSCMMKI